MCDGGRGDASAHWNSVNRRRIYMLLRNECQPLYQKRVSKLNSSLCNLCDVSSKANENRALYDRSIAAKGAFDG